MIDFLKWDVEVSRNEPATLRFDIFEDPNSENVIYWYEAYVNDAGFETHKQGEPVKKLLDGGLFEECIVSVEDTMPDMTTAVCTIAE
jgi:quinol monooxygenase YgiN